MATYDEPEVWVVILETRYRIVAVGASENGARKAACIAYRRSVKAGTNLPIPGIHSNGSIITFFGCNAFGPMRVGEGVSE